MLRQATSQIQIQQCSQALRPVERGGQEKGRHADNTPGKQREPQSGTADAVSNISEASFPARQWGGKRNSAGRTSDFITFEQAVNVIEAAQFALAAGMPFNRHVTIHWEQAGISDEHAGWATGRFLKLAGDWIAKQRSENASTFAWAWVRENDVSGSLHARVKGSHVHILIHLPAGLSIGPMQRRWLRSITGKPYRRKTVKTSRIGGTIGACHSAPNHYGANLESIVGYLLKGTCPKAAAHMGLKRLELGGLIIGKRVSTSENIGRTARLRTGAAGRG